LKQKAKATFIAIPWASPIRVEFCLSILDRQMAVVRLNSSKVATVKANMFQIRPAKTAKDSNVGGSIYCGSTVYIAKANLRMINGYKGKNACACSDEAL
jgi:hypothetical protein